MPFHLKEAVSCRLHTVQSASVGLVLKRETDAYDERRSFEGGDRLDWPWQGNKSETFGGKLQDRKG